MYPVSPQAYDRAITVFSPDGRLFQVEYAKEAVKRGSTAIGITCKDGVVLVANRFVQNNLILLDSIRKVHIIDDNIIATSSGLAADARRLIEMARVEAQKHRVTYSKPISVLQLSRNLANTMQIYTQYGGIRPFGVSMLLTGIDGADISLYDVEPSGAYTGYFATGIGSHKDEVEKLLAEKYSQEMSIDNAISMGIKILVDVCNEDEVKHCNERTLDVALVHKKDVKAKYLSEQEIKKYLSKVK